MKIRRYLFGYLFVRFAKLLAVLALLITAGEILYVVVRYGNQAREAEYRPSGSLGLELRALSDEFAFARPEVARLASVADLAAPQFTGAPTDQAEFAQLLRQLAQADATRNKLKARLTEALEQRTTALRDRIQEAIQEIQRARAAAQPLKGSAPSPAPAEPEAPPPDAAPSPPSAGRTVFQSLEPNDVRAMHAAIAAGRQLMEKLDQAAEKEENQRLIAEAMAALLELDHWLPAEPADRSASPARSPFAPSRAAAPPTDSAPPPDPLTTAMGNYQQIGRMVEDVRRQVGRDWRLDAAILQATRTAESEANACQRAEAQLQMVRLARGTEAARELLIGVAAAFLVLVFADFMQSFFDTASNSAAIRELLEAPKK